MAIQKLLIPIGPVLAGAVVYIPTAAGLSQLAGEYGILLFAGLVVLGVLIFVISLRNMQVNLNQEVEVWCINIEPKLYRDHGDKVGYLKKAKVEYGYWLRRQWRVPTDEIRKIKFLEIIETFNNRSPEQLIRAGHEARKKNAQQSA